jgi:arsenate reductase
MINIYGIPNCDTIIAALQWLTDNEIEYVFWNYKTQGVDKSVLEKWLQHIPLTQLINKKSSTYRMLSEVEKSNTNSQALAILLMIKYPTLIKRPVWNLHNETFMIGWDDAVMRKIMTL